MRYGPSLLGACLGLAALAAGPAPAAVHTVSKCDGHPDGADAPAGGLPGQLRRLINDASAGDLIRIPAGCTITLVGPPGDDNNLNGDVDLRKDLTIQGAGPAASVIDGGGIDRVLHISGFVAVVVSGVTIRNGQATAGGGIALGVGSAGLTNVVITGSRATSPISGGGGIFSGGTLVLSNVTLHGNRAEGGGGGLLATDGSVSLSNVTISGNQAPVGGGLDLLPPSDGSLNNVTVVNNQADALGGGLSFTSNGANRLRLGNTILAGNRRASGLGDDCISAGGGLVSAGSSLVQATPPGSCPLAAADLTGVDPRLGPLAANGGSTPTHALLPGSPARDAGDGGCAAVDQRGVSRPQGARCDLGAFEAGAATAGAFPDFDGDGLADLVVAAGPGGPGEVRVLAGASGAVLLALTPFGPDFPGPLAVAACDLTGDGRPDLVAGGLGPAGPELRALDGATGAPLPAPLGALHPFAPPALGAGRQARLGAPTVACADVNGDGVPDLIAGAPPGAAEGPRVRVFSGVDGTLLREDLPLGAAFPGGVAVGP